MSSMVRPRSILAFFGLLATVACTAVAEAARENIGKYVTVNERTVHFEISARSFEEFRKKLRRYGLKEFGDSNHVASTKTHIFTTLRARGTNGACALSDYSVTADIEYALPMWIEHDRAGPENAKRWRRFYAEARLHEKDHGRIAKGQAREVAVTLSELKPAEDCSKMISAAEAAGDAYLDSNTAQEEYDRHTRRDPSRRKSFDFEAAVRRR